MTLSPTGKVACDLLFILLLPMLGVLFLAAFAASFMVTE